MKKFMYIAAATIAVLSSCSSEDTAENSINNNNNGEAKVFTGTIVNDGVTSRSTLVNNTANWESTDKVCINGAVYSVTPQSDATIATFTKESGDEPTGTYKAFYADGANSGNYWDSSKSSFKLPASYTYAEGKFNMPMYAESTTTDLAFQNICGVLAIKVTSAEMSSVTSITVTSDKAISGACTIKGEDVSGVTKYHAEATGTEDADKTVTLNCSSAVTPTEAGTVFYIPVPVGSHTLTVAVSDGSTTKSMTKSTSVTIERNTIYSVVFKTTAAPSTLLPGNFSVSATKQVQFTKGNLYWDGSAYHFEENQTNYPTSWNTSHVGHFFWSKDASVMYALTYSDDSRSTSDAFFFCEANKNNDANKVDGESGYYALTSVEWTYLINTRDKASSLRKYGVTVGSATNCLIIAPDNYTETLKTSYTLDEVNAAGLVCLPAARYRDLSDFNDFGSNGRYWSATPSSGNAIHACNLYFSSSTVDPASSSNRFDGLSVRLVK